MNRKEVFLLTVFIVVFIGLIGWYFRKYLQAPTVSFFPSKESFEKVAKKEENQNNDFRGTGNAVSSAFSLKKGLVVVKLKHSVKDSKPSISLFLYRDVDNNGIYSSDID